MIVTSDRPCATVVVFVCSLLCGCGRIETVVGVAAISSTPVTVDATAPVLPDAGLPEPPDVADASGDEDAGPDDASNSNPLEADVACAVPGDGSACLDTLSNIGTADFHIYFALTTTETGLFALVNQRASCGFGMFWDLRAFPDRVALETDDGLQGAGHYTHIEAYNHVNDGQPHCIVAQRVNGIATALVDGVPSVAMPSLAAFRQLPQLMRGLDPCEGDGGPPGMVRDGTKPFVGTLANLCITSP